MSYVAEVAVGNGKAVLSQVFTESDNSKLLLFYSRILSKIYKGLSTETGVCWEI